MSGMLDNFVFPLKYDGNSIKRKLTIGDGLSYMKGDEFRVFLMISPYLLYGKLPTKQYNNFMLLVRINRLVASPGLFLTDFEEIKALTKEFMENFLALYGDKRYLTPNFHLFLHLPETILRYSCPSNSWLFFYERLNADLKAIKTNNNSDGNFEKIFLSKFLNIAHSNDQFKKLAKPFNLPEDIYNDLKYLFARLMQPTLITCLK